ncbi:unnamed protein product [Pieris brassicae]|uniref:Partial AB-hydrolase lipase domain-containing protein n=1 Tax=Pieris brassicae TaxID=7116 RepID=A0A9P0XBG7_PIEBR|nr:unnamed protein product [Pieris brassicae]
MADEIIQLLTITLGVLSALSAEVTNTAYLAIQYGHPAEEYHVITEDGYILGIFHLPGYRGLPLLLMHGIMDSSDSWLIRAPIAFLRNLEPPLSLLIEVSSALLTIGRSLQQYEVFGNSLTGIIYRGICSLPVLGYFLCSFGIVFPIAGYDLLEYDYDFHYKVTRMKFPMSISLKNLNHFAQVRKRGRFSQFGYGDGNIEVYGSVQPPDYDLRKVTMSVALLCGQNDKLANQKDVQVLKEALRNIVQFTLLEYKEMNHVDFTWGKNMDKYLLPYILQILDKNI